MKTDEQLMQAYLSGDYLAYECLYQRHAAKVLGFLKKRLSSLAEAEEVFQEVFIKLHQVRHQYDAKYAFSQWLFVIARTSLLDHFRKSKRQVKIADDVSFENVFSS